MGFGENADFTWVSTHIYITGRTLRFLTEGLLPLLEQLNEKIKIDQYFFIRYRDPEFHIRLRLKVEKNKVKKVEAFILDFFRIWTSQGAVAPKELISITAIKFIEYQREMQRYGGLKSIGIIEKQFCYSSKTCLQILKEDAAQNYESILGKAIQMHLSLVATFEFDQDHTLQLFKKILSNWSVVHLNAFTVKEQVEKNQEELIQQFQKSLTPNRLFVLEQISSFLEALKQGKKFESGWMQEWIEDLKKTGDALKKIHSEQLPLIVADLIHMTNNRLGIFNKDESYLAYIIIESLEYAKHGR